MRGILGLRYVLPALFTSVVATALAWIVLPDAPTYLIPAYTSSTSVALWALLAGPIAGAVSAGYVRLISWADRNRPRGWQRLAAPFLGLGALDVVSIWYPQLLGNGKDISQLAFTGQVTPLLLGTIFILNPAATALCIRCGAPGGFFTPSLTVGAMLGGLLGYAWSGIWPGVPAGLLALLGAGPT